MIAARNSLFARELIRKKSKALESDSNFESEEDY